MKINTEYIWSDRQQRSLLMKWESFNEADVILCKGASGQQTQLSDSQQAFNNTLMSDYSQRSENWPAKCERQSQQSNKK